MAEKTDLSLAVSETPKIGYVPSGTILSNGPQSALQLARGPIVDQNCMLAGTSYSLESKVYFVNVYARMSLNQFFFWHHLPAHVGHEKEGKYIDPSTPPWTHPRYQ